MGLLSQTSQKNLFEVLSENGRLGETQGVIEGFNELVASHKGEVTVTITSASPLPRDIQSRLESTLKQSETAQRAKTLKVVNKVCYLSLRLYTVSNPKCKVNPSVLGGLIVDFGDKTIDLSVASRVNKFNNLLHRMRPFLALNLIDELIVFNDRICLILYCEGWILSLQVMFHDINRQFVLPEVVPMFTMAQCEYR